MTNVLSTERRAAIVAALVEGMSVRGAGRMLDVSKDTVNKLALDLAARGEIR